MNSSTDNAVLSHRAPCESCGSKDNVAVYADGHSYCYGCQDYRPPPVDTSQSFSEPPRETIGKTKGVAMGTGTIAAIGDRRLSKATCEKYNVTIEYDKDGSIGKHYYPYYDKDSGELVGSKVRTVATKDFYATGTLKNVGLFGQHLFKGGQKYITIVEGELDALAVSEMFKGKWPVVSIRSGASSAVKDIKENLDWLETFENVVICFDNDKVGKEATKAVTPLFTPNKAKVVSLPLKDASDMLMAGRIEEFVREWWNAEVYRPDGIVCGSKTWDIIKQQKEIKSLDYPWSGLNSLTYGFRRKELVTITSGSGMGKSQMVRELEHWLIKNTEDNIGILALEESVDKTALGIMSIEANLPLHLPTTTVSDEDKYSAWDKTLNNNRVFLLDHFGSTSEDNLLSKIRYMAKGLDCKWIVLDHLSIVVSDQGEGDERKAIDSIMTKLRSLVQETGIGMFLVSHLRRPQGKGHEDGANVSLSELRGSAAIAQLSDMVLGLERNQQHENEETRNTTTVRVLKNRFAGLTGPACYLFYDKTTGRMRETSCPKGDDSNKEF